MSTLAEKRPLSLENALACCFDREVLKFCYTNCPVILEVLRNGSNGTVKMDQILIKQRFGILIGIKLVCCNFG